MENRVKLTTAFSALLEKQRILRRTRSLSESVIEGEAIEYFVPSSLTAAIVACPVNPLNIFQIRKLDEKMSDVFNVMQEVAKDEIFQLGEHSSNAIIKENNNNKSYDKIARLMNTK